MKAVHIFGNSKSKFDSVQIHIKKQQQKTDSTKF